ncbi:MAG TPA: hypothetical protein VGI68_05650 [Mycobacterium sp.]|jgi:hypothetical protein
MYLLRHLAAGEDGPTLKGGGVQTFPPVCTPSVEKVGKQVRTAALRGR